MKTVNKILPVLLLLPLLMAAKISKAADTDPKVVKITATDQMKFSLTDIEAVPGQTVKVVLNVESNFPKMAMSHNFVLLEAEADAMAVATAAAKARDNDYIPAEFEDQIVAYTGLAGGGETVEVTFTVPEKPGTYEYICSFPGHFSSGMKGTLTVKEPAS